MDVREPVSTARVFEQLLAPHPDVLAGLDDAHRAAWGAVSPDLLDLCRVRIAMLLRLDADAVGHELEPTVVEDLPSWPSSPRFSATERACLAFTEQFVVDVASVDDAQVEAVGAELGPSGLADFVHALVVVEQRLRLQLAWARLFPEVS